MCAAPTSATQGLPQWLSHPLNTIGLVMLLLGWGLAGEPILTGTLAHLKRGNFRRSNPTDRNLLRGGVLGGLLGLLGVLVLLGLLGGRQHRRLPLLRRLWRPGSAVESTLRVGHSILIVECSTLMVKRHSILRVSLRVERLNSRVESIQLSN